MEHRLLVASDGSENALRAAKFAAKLAAAAPNIKVTVIIVNDILDKIKYYSLRTPTVIGEVDAFFKEQAQEALDLTLEIFSQKGVKATGVVKMGNPAKDIVDYAHAEGIKHIVIGSRGMGSLRGIVLGSVSSKVVQLADCPVTIVK
ncbi:MAG: universal stress protein [Peptococcaceae bacterium]|nr:universal stress protein [Peptococcaceae bacterium]